MRIVSYCWCFQLVLSLAVFIAASMSEVIGLNAGEFLLRDLLVSIELDHRNFLLLASRILTV